MPDKHEPLVYERVLRLNKMKSLTETPDGIIASVREFFNTHSWDSVGDESDIDFTIWFNRGRSGFRAGDRVRIIIERVEAQ